MDRVISFVNFKGGVGRSTIVVTLAEVLATALFKKVLVIDLDPQGAATVMLCGVDRTERLVKQKATLIDLLLCSESVTPQQYIERDVSDIILLGESRLDIIPIQPGMGGYSEEAFSAKGVFTLVRDDDALFFKIGDLLERYDYILIDCPPNMGCLTRLGLWFSDFYIVPTIPDFLSVRMLYKTTG